MPPSPPERRAGAPIEERESRAAQLGGGPAPVGDGPFEVARGGVTLFGERAGEGTPIVLLHGLTAMRRYVVMGSSALERAGHLVVAYDARGHGRSSPAPEPSAYGYDVLADDLEAVLDALALPRAVLAGASMGAHTALRLALRRPELVAGLVLITPGVDPLRPRDASELAHWDALARGLRERGVEGFVAAYDFDAVPEKWRATVQRVVRQRLSAHEHPLALADALETTPRSAPFQSLDELAAIVAPTTVVGSRDDADPGHPLEIAERYAEHIPGARLLVEEPGGSPIAWQGGRLSHAIAELAQRACAGMR
ncbi:MAG TPA: alpha/beta hydrolase [Solirubrobacteraceae bacterium]|jgi:pimeloyl-ACP methyl ester carboxylesterase|nr:alpha/beta hydrolase [Solirubrobacteraceae bacterium]